jgi:hypothetical protein
MIFFKSVSKAGSKHPRGNKLQSLLISQKNYSQVGLDIHPKTFSQNQYQARETGKHEEHLPSLQGARVQWDKHTTSQGSEFPLGTGQGYHKQS